MSDAVEDRRGVGAFLRDSEMRVSSASSASEHADAFAGRRLPRVVRRHERAHRSTPGGEAARGGGNASAGGAEGAGKGSRGAGTVGRVFGHRPEDRVLDIARDIPPPRPQWRWG